MTRQMAILIIPAMLVVLGLVFHSLRTRGKRDTLEFFGAALIFGVLRGNIIWWITTVHFEGKFPYIFAKQVLGIYHDSFTADAGWILCLYLGMVLASRILQRIPALQGRVFPLLSLACLFHLCLAYAVESTAITMGWWQWTLSTKSSVLRDVPTTGLWAWFSVGFDFWMPYLLIRYCARPGRTWPYLTILIFPLHMLTHLSNERAGHLLPITPYGIYHWLMLLAVMILPFASALRLERPWLGEALPASQGTKGKKGREGVARAAGPVIRAIPTLGLLVVVAVLLYCDLILHHAPGLLTAKLPLLLYFLLTLSFVPALVVLVLAALAAIFGGVFFVAPLGIPLFYFALKGKERFEKWPWLKWAYLLVPIVLSVWHYQWSVAKDRLDMRYWALIDQGTALAKHDSAGAIAHFKSASELKPYSIPAYERLVIIYTQQRDLDDAEAVLKKLMELRPASAEVRANFGTIAIMRGNYDEAQEWFEKALKLDPHHRYSRRMLANLDKLRQGGKWKDATSLPDQ